MITFAEKNRYRNYKMKHKLRDNSLNYFNKTFQSLSYGFTSEVLRELFLKTSLIV